MNNPAPNNPVPSDSLPSRSVTLKTPCPQCGRPLTQRYEVALSMGEDGGLVRVGPPVCASGHVFVRGIDDPVPD